MNIAKEVSKSDLDLPTNRDIASNPALAAIEGD
jgi:hypothetical protein